MGSIGEFFISLGVKADTATLKDFSSSLGSMQISTFGAIAALGAIAYEFQKLTSEATTAAVSFQSFSSQTGLSSQQLQRWQIAAEQANVSAEIMSSSIMALQSNLEQIKLGQGNIMGFKMLGVSPMGKDAFEVMQELREAIKNKPPAMAGNFLKSMGLSPDMLRVLQLSNKEFKEMSHSFAGMKPEQEKIFLKIRLELTKFTQSLRYAQYAIAQTLGPAFIIILRGASAFLNTFGGKVLIFSSILGVLAVSLAKVGMSLSILAASLFANPVGLAVLVITAAFVALMLVLDDFATYFRGGKSITGMAIDGLKKMADIDLSKLTNTMTHLLDLWDKMGILGKIGSLTAAGMALPVAGAGGFLIPGIAAAGTARKIIQQTNNITATSNADPKEHAEDIGKAITRQMNAADLQIDNQGD